MGQPAAKQGDQVTAVDTHVVMVPSPSGQVPTPLPHEFSGMLNGGLSTNVNAMGKPAATVGSTADNIPPHIPTPPGTAFQTPPANRGTVQKGSSTVMINSKPAARSGDAVITCNDPADAPVGAIVAVGTVLVG
jgi:uncharacterized Zn-binding protein involved in type VI secretion